jgi:hypothetical protein
MVGKPRGRLGGRRRGGKNKLTLFREQEALKARRALAAINSNDEYAIKQLASQKRGKDILVEFANLFAQMAALYQPIIPPGAKVPEGWKPDKEEFLTYAKLAVATADKAADFHDPRFKAIVMAQAQTDAERLRGATLETLRAEILAKL